MSGSKVCEKDVEFGLVLSEDFGQAVEKFPGCGDELHDLINFLSLFPNEDFTGEIRARCVLAYRRELARCLAEHYAKLAGE